MINKGDKAQNDFVSSTPYTSSSIFFYTSFMLQRVKPNFLVVVSPDCLQKKDTPIMYPSLFISEPIGASFPISFGSGVFSLSYLKQLSEVRAARGQDDFVRRELLRVAGQSHVHKVLLLLQVSERVDQRLGVVLPPETEVRRVAVAVGRGRSHRGRC